MAKITWTSEAERWLKEIYDYIAEDNIVAAENVVSGIYQKTQILLEHPEIGYEYEHESREEIRILLYGHYRITYIVKSTDEITILGVFHGACISWRSSNRKLLDNIKSCRKANIIKYLI